MIIYVFEFIYMDSQNYIDPVHNSAASVIFPGEEIIQSFVNTASNVNIIFMIDVSGSMSSCISSNSTQSKLSLVTQSVIEVFKYLIMLGDHGHNVSTSLYTFNDEVSEIFSNVISKSSEHDNIMNYILSLRTSSCTNIRKALLHCNSLLNSCDQNAINIVVFITDGYNSNASENNEMINEFKQSGFSDNYYSIGLGIAGDYDAALMPELFGKFIGCPTSEDMCDNIIASPLSGTSVIIKDAIITFNDYVIKNYKVYTSMEKSNDRYTISKINLSTNIVLYFERTNTNFSCSSSDDCDIVVRISGTDSNGNIKMYSINVSENYVVDTNTSLFGDFFLLEKEYLDTISDDSISPQNCRIKLENLLIRVKRNHESVKRHNFEKLIPFYENLCNTISNFTLNLRSIHVSALTEQEFQNYLRLGSQCAREISSNYAIPSLASQTSSAVTQTFSQNVDNDVFDDVTKSITQFTELHNAQNKTTERSKRCVSQPSYLDIPRPPKLQRSSCTNNVFSNIDDVTNASSCKSIVLSDLNNLDDYEEFSGLFTFNNLDNYKKFSDLSTFGGKCIICCDKTISSMYLPCKHSCVCTTCSQATEDCPICRTPHIAIKELASNSKCYKCKTNIPNVLFLPCSHVILCQTCMKNNPKNKCKECKSNITSAIDIFI